jgi:hypothetical protein
METAKEAVLTCCGRARRTASCPLLLQRILQEVLRELNDLQVVQRLGFLHQQPHATHAGACDVCWLQLDVRALPHLCEARVHVLELLAGDLFIIAKQQQLLHLAARTCKRAPHV